MPYLRLPPICALVTLAFSLPAHAGAVFYNFGAAAGDAALPYCDDCSQQVSLRGVGIAGSSVQSAFYNHAYNSLFVNNNGVMSFVTPLATNGYVPAQFPVGGEPPMLAPYWVDVDTRSMSGSVWYRTVVDPTQLAKFSADVSSLYLGERSFNATFAEVVTWDHVTVYGHIYSTYDAATKKYVYDTDTFQMLLVSDGIQSYTIYKYLENGLNAPRGTASGNVFPSYGFQDGYGNNYNGPASTTSFMWSGHSPYSVSLDGACRSSPCVAGNQIFQIGIGAPSDIMLGAYAWGGGSGSWDGTFSSAGGATFGGAAGTVELSAAGFGRRLVLNSSGYTFTAASTANSLQLDNLQLGSDDAEVTFAGNLVLLTHAGAGGMTAGASPKQMGTLYRGNVTFTDNSVLVARDAGMVNGASIALKKDAQIQIWTADASTRASSLSFDKAAGGSGGTLDLRGFGTTFGKVSSVSKGSGIIKNSGATTATLSIDFDGGTSEYSGTIQDKINLAKAGSGVQVLSGTNSYTGATLVNGGELRVNGSANASAFTVASSATLSGSGSIGTLTLNGILAPGNSPGQLSAGDTTFAGGSTYLWQINDASGAAGVGYDFLSVHGQLTLKGSSAAPITIRLQSLLADNSAGTVFNFDAARNYSYTLVSATDGIVGYSSTAFVLDTSAFINPLHGGIWAVGVAGNDLQLTFTAAAVPEPSGYAMLLAGLAGVGVVTRRRRAVQGRLSCCSINSTQTRTLADPASRCG